MTRRPSTSVFTLGLAVLALAAPAYAQEGGVVTQGGATITNPTPTVTQINQTTEKAVIQWNDFSIAAGSTAIFSQPSSTSIALNQVTGIAPSSILGSLQANGQVWILNPNGILFGQNATINVGALMASTLSLSENDFMSGNYHLLQDPSKAASYVVNQGSVTATSFAALIAPLVENSGSITSNGGQVYLLGTGEAILDINGAGLVGYSIGSVTGQTVHIREDAVSDVVRAVVNSGGLVEAGSIIEDGSGVVRLVGAGGLSINTGTISVSGSTGVSGGQVVLNSTNATLNLHGASIDAGGSGLASAGGTILLLSKDDTYFRGTLTATGGTTGDGGFIEVSGANQLWYLGIASASPQAGANGTLVIDPAALTIISGAGPGDLDAFLPDILEADTVGGTDTVSEAALEGVAAGTDIVLEATDLINMDDLADGTLTLSASSISFETMAAGSDITFDDPTNSIVITGPITFISGDALTLGNLTSAGNTIDLAAGGLVEFNTLNAGTGDIMIIAGGEILQGTGTVTASLLDATAGADITFTGSDVDNFTASSSGGSVDLLDNAGALTLGDVTSDGDVSILTNDSLLVNGDLDATGFAVTLASTLGEISQTGGTITAGAVTANAADGITLGGGATTFNATSLTATNTTATLVSITDAGGLASAVINNVNGNVTIVTTGAIGDGSVTGQLFTLTTTGGATLSSFNITALTVTNNTSGNVTFTGGTNAFTVQGTGIVTPGATTLTGAGTITIAAAIGTLNQNLTLGATAGEVNRTGGTTLNIGTGTLSVTAAAGSTLGSDATGAITIGNFNATLTGAGTLSIQTTAGVTINAVGLNGITSAAGGNVILQANTGTITTAANISGAGTVTLIAVAGNIARSSVAHAISVTTLIVQVSTSTMLNHSAASPFTSANLQGSVSSLGASLTLRTGAAVNILGMSSNNGTLALGTFVFGPPVTISGNLTAGTGTIAVMASGSTITILPNVNITTTGTVTLGASNTTTITQQAGTGIISAGQLNLQSTLGQTIIGFQVVQMRITNLTSGAVSITGGIGNLQFAVQVTANNGPLTVSTSGSITINITITNPNQTTTLIAGAGTGLGQIIRTGTAVINCATLILDADQGINLPSGSVGSGVTSLSAVNNDPIFGLTSGVINISTATTATLNIVGSGLVNTGGDITLTAAGPIALNTAGVTNFPFTTTLTAGGAINGIAPIDTFRLNLSSVGGQNLDNLFIVEELQSTNTGSGATLLEKVGTLTIVGTGVVNTVGGITIRVLGGGSLIISANVTTSNQTTLFDVSGGEIRQTAGLIQSGTLLAFSDSGIILTNVGSMSLEATASMYGPINITSSGDLTLTDITISNLGGNISILSTGALTVSGTVSTTNGFIHMQSGGDFTATGSITATTGVRLTSAGALDMGTTGVINGPARVDLDGVNVTLNDITAGGTLTVDATGTLSVGTAGVINTAGIADLQAAGAVTIDGDIIAGGPLTLVTAGTLAVSNGGLLHSGASVVVASGLDMTLAGGISTFGAFTANAGAGLSQTLTGTISAQSVGAHALGGVLTLGGSSTVTGTFEGYGLSGLTQAGTGSIDAANVTLNSTGDVELHQITGSGAVDVQAGVNASITQSTAGVVTGAVSVTFQAGESVFLGGVDGGSILIMAVNGVIADHNDGIGNTLNIASSGNVILVSNGNIGSVADPIEVQGGIVTVHTNGVLPPTIIALSGTTTDGIIHLGSAPPGTIIFLNESLLAGGGNTDAMMNWYRDLVARGYDVWSQAVLTDDDTTQHRVIMRSRLAPKRGKTTLR